MDKLIKIGTAYIRASLIKTITCKDCKLTIGSGGDGFWYETEFSSPAKCEALASRVANSVNDSLSPPFVFPASPGVKLCADGIDGQKIGTVE